MKPFLLLESDFLVRKSEEDNFFLKNSQELNFKIFIFEISVKFLIFWISTFFGLFQAWWKLFVAEGWAAVSCPRDGVSVVERGCTVHTCPFWQLLRRMRRSGMTIKKIKTKFFTGRYASLSRTESTTDTFNCITRCLLLWNRLHLSGNRCFLA